MVSRASEEHSQRIFWVIQTIFGYLIGRSFHSYASVFVPLQDSDIVTITVALVTVYALTIWSWIDFSYTSIVAPYQFLKTSEKFRFLVDLMVVLTYSYLLAYVDSIKLKPSGEISGFLFANFIVFVGYLGSGYLRRIQYGSRASKVGFILLYLILFLISTAAYSVAFEDSTNKIFINRTFIVITFILIVSYRLIRSISGKRTFRIGVDVDGVLANQIVGVLPIIKKDFNIELKYEDIVDWKLPIKDSSIDRIIVNEQKHRSYVIGMPLHNGAKEVLSKLIQKYYVSIATARPPETDEWTKEWLAKNRISFDGYHNLREGFKHNVDFDVLIDDYPGNIKSFLEKHNGKAILFSQPWNHDTIEMSNYINEGRLFVVKKWDEIPELLRKALK
jgi:5'(3')-deoxyribonucleotidase